MAQRPLQIKKRKNVDPDVAHYRAVLARSSVGHGNAEVAAQARAGLALAKRRARLSGAVEEVVAAWPDLSDEQRARIAAALSSEMDGDGP